MISVMIPSCICEDFAILGKNSQILCKNREKLENIISMHIGELVQRFALWYLTALMNTQAIL